MNALSKAFAQNAYGLVLNLQGSQENKGRRRKERGGERRERIIHHVWYLFILSDILGIHRGR